MNKIGNGGENTNNQISEEMKTDIQNYIKAKYGIDNFPNPIRVRYKKILKDLGCCFSTEKKITSIEQVNTLQELYELLETNNLPTIIEKAYQNKDNPEIIKQLFPNNTVHNIAEEIREVFQLEKPRK